MPAMPKSPKSEGRSSLAKTIVRISSKPRRDKFRTRTQIPPLTTRWDREFGSRTSALGHRVSTLSEDGELKVSGGKSYFMSIAMVDHLHRKARLRQLGYRKTAAETVGKTQELPYFSGKLSVSFPLPLTPNVVELRIGSDSYGLQNPPSPPFVKGGNSMESLQIIPLS